ncbi:MAG: hypothetical protein AAGB93_15490 [Planctomycetota bacterium]
MPALPTIRRARAVAAASLASCSCLGLAVAQVPQVTVLARAGDPLPGGESVVSIEEPHVGDEGTWAAFLEYGSGTVFERVLAVDGSFVLKTGDAGPGGSTITSLSDLAVSRTGEVMVLARTENGGVLTDRVLLDGTQIVASGDLLPTPQGPLEIESISSAEYDGVRLFLICNLSTPIGFVEATWFGRVLPGGLLDEVVWFAGDTIPGSTRPFLRGVLDVSVALAQPSVAVELDGPTGPVGAILQSGFIVAEHGGPAPIAGSTWDFTQRSRGRTGANGGRLLAGVAALPGGGTNAIVALDGAVIAQQGQPLPGLGGPTVGTFTSAPLFLTDDRTPLFVVPLDGGGALMAGPLPILRAGDELPGGAVILNLFEGSIGQTFDATSDGRTLAVTVDVAGVGTTLILLERGPADPVDCTPAPNSTGVAGRIAARGSRAASDNDLTLTATSLPLSSFGYLLTSLTAQTTPMAGGGQGTLCLGGDIGRFVGQVGSSGTDGRIATTVDLVSIPQPTGAVVGAPGETWYFQLWHRDGVMGVPTSNFTEAVSVTLE